ncbi:MAG TPA: hypothetical protein VFE96_06645 [Candidatus Bathyarchaeia archaeon]|nr:hypothetical protein [Candidatus Bathyarchaeia archaeon]
MTGTRRKTSKTKSKSKHATKTRKTKRSPKSTHKRGSTHRRRTLTKTEDVTYVYECTRPGCGYKIVRDEKAEPGQLRNDLKCPKCHHIEFRCLGKGDLPETLQVEVPANPVDLDAVRPSNMASN